MGMGIIFGALSGAGDAAGKSLAETQKFHDEESLMQERANLETEKAKVLAQYQNDLQNAPMSRAGAMVSDASQQDVPVTAAPVTTTSGADPASAGFNADGSATTGLVGMTRAQVQAYNNPDMLKQYDRQIEADNKTAQDAVAGQTRKVTTQEAMQTAYQHAMDNGDMQAAMAIKSAIPDKTIKLGKDEALYSAADPSKLIVANTAGADRALMLEDRKDQRQEKTLNSREDIAQFRIDNANKDSQFVKELKQLYPEGSPEFNEAMRQRINKETGINSPGGGGRATVYNGRIIASGNEIGTALQNIVDLPVNSNSGFMGMGQTNKNSLFASSIDALKNELNSSQIKTYNTMWTGVSRNLGTLETSGLATTGDLIKSIDKLAFVPGDTGYDALRKLAEVRQITTAALEPKLADPAVPPQQKQYIDSIIQSVQKAVPYTHSDLTKFDNLKDQNPSMTFNDFAAQNGIGEASSTPAPSNGWSNLRVH